jgi:formate-dependent nitrite reductase cytochrome c552 subunit
MIRTYMISIILLSLPLSAEVYAACNVCHSKNPEMVKMHKALQQKPEIGCFDCHKIGDKLMGKGQPKDRESQLIRRGSEAVCKTCHQAGR